MSKVREAIKVLAATAALTPMANAFLGEQAMAKGAFPGVKDVAAKINDLPKLKKGAGTKEGGPSVYYQGRLPHGQRVSVSLTSRTEVHGKPDPRTAVALDVDVYRPRRGQNFVRPLVAVSFLKGADGKWTAHEQQAVPGHPNATFNVEELGQVSADQQIVTVQNGQTVAGSVASMGGRCAANYVLEGLEADAYNVLDFIADGEAVSLRSVQDYSAIGHVGCHRVSYKRDA